MRRQIAVEYAQAPSKQSFNGLPKEGRIICDHRGEEMTDALFRPTLVDLSDNTTSVTTSPALLRGVSIQTGNSGQSVPIKNGSAGSTIFTIPASASAGDWYECGDTRMESGIYVDPNDAATGIISVIWKPLPVVE